MTPTQQLVLTIIGTFITAAGVSSPFILHRFNKRDRKIELLETKNDLLEKANHKLELQNLELRVTGWPLISCLGSYQQEKRPVRSLHEVVSSKARR